MRRIVRMWGLGTAVWVLMAVGAMAEQAAPAKHGLMWHRSGLPAVFPLQVTTLGPQDYYVTLTDVKTDKVVLAAYIEGGRFFRVRVPPGTFEVRFAYGNVWQGEADLFGPGNKTTVYDVPRPLTFNVRNFNTKAGHLLDLRDLSPGQEARVAPQDMDLCQGLRLVKVEEDDERGSEFMTWYVPPAPAFRWEVRVRQC